ncbi:hypothetical protein N7517_003588 [Penicillium concentricum]|uniref:Uncharacterized protein n=1 Tax=Penicillium concentricum TaxID=293559 RepID=A0A9W9S4M9_9EURO|nr:uncharacterized protein N7517_003588 [Penicillium concentricum]KAJ5371582.1 hypothetical protein N7517_003588 [Penicillium concentricum]
MAFPPNDDEISTWQTKLKALRLKCEMCLKDEITAGCHNPHAWKSEEDNGNDPIYTDGVLMLDSIKRWKVDGSPDDMKKHFSPTTGTTWRPKNVRLCDAGVIYALLTLSTSYRAKHLAYDFDARGEVRTSHVPRAPSVVVTQNNIRFLLAWRGVYVLTGGYNDAGWLLASDYDIDAPHLVAGLVVAPPHLKTNDNLNTDMAEYDPPQMMASAKVKDIWEFGHKTFNIRLCGTRQWENKCLILSNRKTGYQTIHKLEGIHRLISPSAWGRSPNAADFESFCMPTQYPARTDDNWDPVEQSKTTKSLGWNF